MIEFGIANCQLITYDSSASLRLNIFICKTRLPAGPLIGVRLGEFYIKSDSPCYRMHALETLTAISRVSSHDQVSKHDHMWQPNRLECLSLLPVGGGQGPASRDCVDRKWSVSDLALQLCVITLTEH